MNPVLNTVGGVSIPTDASAYQEAARKWRKELLHLPIIGLEESLKVMTLRLGIRYKETVGSASLGAQFAPYKADMKAGKDLKIDFRTLETHLGAVVIEFEPNSVASKVIGEKAATKGEALKSAEVAKEVLVCMSRDLSEALNDAIWSAVRNSNGTTTADLFDGFDTITGKEITAGNVAAAKKNYVKLTEDISSTNAYDVIKAAIRKADRRLLKENDLYLYCSPEVREMYDDAYLATHKGAQYYDKYEQAVIEGTKVHFADMSNKLGSKYIHLSCKKNMLIGADQMSDAENITVEKHAPFVIDFIATLFFGVQFESVDSRRLFVIELKTAPAAA